MPTSRPSIRALPVIAGRAMAPRGKKASGSALGAGALLTMVARAARERRATWGGTDDRRNLPVIIASAEAKD